MAVSLLTEMKEKILLKQIIFPDDAPQWRRWGKEVGTLNRILTYSCVNMAFRQHPPPLGSANFRCMQ
jgi:hypothetical protein